jgi:hypothetical protein
MSLRPGENWVRSKPVHPRCGLYLPCRGWVPSAGERVPSEVEVGPPGITVRKPVGVSVGLSVFILMQVVASDLSDNVVPTHSSHHGLNARVTRSDGNDGVHEPSCRL